VTCNTNYTAQTDKTCKANTQTFDCIAKPSTGTSRNTVSSYTQTWSSTAWTPAETTTEYNTSPSDTACRYTCASWYWRLEGFCQQNSCASTSQENWEFTGWTPTAPNTTRQAINSNGPCYVECDSWRTWDWSACESAVWVIEWNQDHNNGAWFTRREITISWSWDSYTIMDRNLWATVVWGSACTSSSCRWDYYQWGKNVAYSSAWSVATSTTLATTATRPSTYWSPKFIIWNSSYRYDWVKIKNDDLWWWSWDIETSNWVWTSVDRQWPCPTGRHVPSVLEWRWLIYIYFHDIKGRTDYVLGNSLSVSSIWISLMDDLKLPRAGLRSRSSGNMDVQTSQGAYWSSSPDGGHAFRVHFVADDVYPAYSNNRAHGFSVRCFKN
jgi:hypothetical protein